MPVSGPSGGEDLAVRVEASEADTYFWTEGKSARPEVISSAELSARLFDYQQRVRTPRVLVGGNEKARFGGAVKALDEIRKAGITQVSIETIEVLNPKKTF